MKTLNFPKLMALAAFAALVIACGKEPIPEIEPEPEKSNAAQLSSFILLSDNPGIVTRVSAYVNSKEVRFSIPEAANPASLKPVLTVSKAATVKINGQEYSKENSYDFSGRTIIEVTSESGLVKNSYEVLWDRGINEVDYQMYKFMDLYSVPGVSVSIMAGTDIVYERGYGYSNRTTKEKCTENHLFRMASISKQFCAMSIMKLKEQGKLNLDAQVFGTGGILESCNFRTTSYHEGITVRHLLSHSSGMCAGLDDPAFTSKYRYYNGNSSKPVPTDTIIQRTLDARKTAYNGYVPGGKYNYSNVGYCTLHRIVEVVSGKDYETFLKEEVLAPMGITDTHIGGYENERRPNECVYYSQDGGNGYLNPLRELAGAAGIITSSHQMMEILKHVDGNNDVPDTFSPETLKEMYTPFKYSGENYTRYGLGWRMNHTIYFANSHYHGGNLAGTATMWVGAATGPVANPTKYKKPMSGAIICNTRSYKSPNFDGNINIDTAFFVILADMFDYFNK